jgi:anti-anti-sigma factor
METIHKIIQDGIVIEKVNLIRATLNEAYDIKEILNDDMFDYEKIIVDLTSCDYVDSTFLGALVYSYRKMKERNGTIVLIISDNFFSKSIIFSEISSIFRVYYTLKDALASFAEDNKKEPVTD